MLFSFGYFAAISLPRIFYVILIFSYLKWFGSLGFSAGLDFVFRCWIFSWWGLGPVAQIFFCAETLYRNMRNKSGNTMVLFRRSYLILHRVPYLLLSWSHLRDTFVAVWPVFRDTTRPTPSVLHVWTECGSGDQNWSLRGDHCSIAG